ncbi:hypothetical protein GE061_003425 [Apolygus lucorum]|uniref:FLYWCH-type domain-containing protein n=1 Tax=Apolygus lucorum TaxID=248454 RepID=A0A8S9X243_APOLU|nr:hypothetical protein GE061_003425 [Apolygus lucorum]
MKNVGPLKSIFLGGEEYRRWYKSKHGVVTWRCKMYNNAPLRCNARLYTDSGFNILKERSFYIHNHGSEGKEKSPSPTTFSQDFLSLSQPSILDENEQNLRDVTHPEQTKPTDRDSMHSSNLDGNSSPSKCALGYGRNVKLRYRGYLFIKRYQLRNGLFRWSCVKSKCSASIYTDSALNLTKSFCRFTHTHKPPPRNDSGIEIQSPLQIADNRDNQGGGSYSSVVRRVSVVLKKVKVPYYFENNSESVEIGGEARQQIGKEDSLRYMTKITETPRRRGRGRGGYRGRGIRRRRGFQKGDCQRNTTDIAIKDVFSLPHELRQPLTTDESVPERALVRSTSAEIMHDRAIPSAHGLAETTQQEGDKPCLVALPLQIKRQKKLKRGRKPGVNYRKLAKCPGLPPQETVRRSPEDTVAPDSSAYFRHPGVLEDPLRTVPSEAFNLDELQHQEVVLVPSPEPTPEKTLTRRSRKSLIGKRRRKKGEGVAYLRWLRKNYREKPTRRSMRFSVKSEKIDFTYEQLQRIQCGEVIDIDSDNESTTVNQLNENSALKISNLTSEGGPSSSSSRVVLDDERICPSNITATQTVYEAPCVQVVQQSGLPGSSSDYQTDSNDQTVASAATHSVFYEPFVSVVHHTGESLNCQPSISDQMDAHNSNVKESYTSFAPILQPTGEFPTFGNTPVNCEHPYAHMCPPNEFSCTSAVHNSHSPVDFKDVMLLDTPLSPDSVIDTIVLSD